jgi:formylmethanofuran dehydrogenase subunit E
MDNEIKLLKNNDNRTDSDIEKVREFYRFLTGEEMPEKISMGRGHAPKMSEKKAFSIIWYLQEHLSIFPDTIERCSVCGELFDTNSEGIYWETKGKHYCGGCSDIVPYNYDRGRR